MSSFTLYLWIGSLLKPTVIEMYFSIYSVTKVKILKKYFCEFFIFIHNKKIL